MSPSPSLEESVGVLLVDIFWRDYFVHNGGCEALHLVVRRRGQVTLADAASGGWLGVVFMPSILAGQAAFSRLAQQVDSAGRRSSRSRGFPPQLIRHGHAFSDLEQGIVLGIQAATISKEP